MTWYSLALISALFISIYEIVQKKTLFREHSFDLLAASSFLMLMLSLPLLRSENFYFVDSTTLLMIFIKCIFMVSALIFATRSLRHMEVSEYSPLMNLSPIFLIVMSFLFLGERISFVNLLGISLIISGAYILELRDGIMSPIKKMYEDKYMHFIIFSMIFGSMSGIMDKFIFTRGISVETFFFYNRLIVAILLFLISTIFYNGYKDMSKCVRRSFIPILIASLAFIAADFTYFMAVAIPFAKIALIIPLKRMSTLISTFVGGEFFKEKRILRKSISCMIMIVGVFFVVQ